MTYQTKCCEMKGKKLNFWQFSKTLKTAAMFRLTFLFVWQPLSFHVIYPALPVMIFLQTGSLKQQSSNHKIFMISYDSLFTSSIKMLINHCMKSLDSVYLMKSICWKMLREMIFIYESLFESYRRFDIFDWPKT